MTINDLTPLPNTDALRYAGWFAHLADPIRVRLLHTVANTDDALTIGELADLLQIDRRRCARHVDRLASAGLVLLNSDTMTIRVSPNPAAGSRLPHPADVVLGLLNPSPAPTPGPTHSPGSPAGLTVRALQERDWDAVRRIYAEGIATGNATFETEPPTRQALESKWLPGHRWVAEVDGEVAGWTAITPVSARPCYAGVGESSVYVGAGVRGRGVGTALLHRQVSAADADGLWTLQTSIFPENRVSIRLHHSAGYRTLALRKRIAQHHGRWRDTVLLERVTRGTT